MDKLFISWNDFHQDTCRLGWCLRSLNKNWDMIVSVKRGGLVLAGILNQLLNIYHIETVCIASYDDNAVSQTNMNIFKKFESERQDILVVDDLIETSTTLQSITRMLPNATKACVYAKTSDTSCIDAFAKKMPLPHTWIGFPWGLND